jgi:branched-chain amino acid transport system permease protein
MLDAVLELIILGLIQGGVYALCAVGVTLIFGVLDIVNIAQGEFVALGGYAALVAVTMLGASPLIGVAGAMIGAFAIGLLIFPLLIAPMKRRLGRKPAGALYLVLTLGLSIFLQNAMLAVAGGDYFQVPAFVTGSADLVVTFVSYQRLLAGGVAVLGLAGLLAFLRLHPEGRAMRAVGQNPEAAQSVGINLNRTYTLTIAVSVMFAALAGALMAPMTAVYPSVGFQFTIKAFAIVILGGLGNVVGSLIASFVLSLSESLSILVLPSEWQSGIAFAVMIGVLLIRPQGFGSRRVM